MGHFFNNMSIKKKFITVLVLILTAAITVVVGIRAMQIQDQQRALIIERLQGNANLSVGIFSTVRNYTEGMLDVVATMPYVQEALTFDAEPVYEGLKENLRALFYGMNHTDEDGVLVYANIFLFDEEFNTVVKARPEGTDVDLSDEAFFGNILAARNGEAYTSPVVRNAETGRMQFLFTQPVMVDGNFIGLAAILSNTEVLAYFLREPTHKYDSFINIADSKGTIFFSNRPAYMGRHVDDLGVFEAFGTIPLNEMFNHTSAITGIEKIAYITVEPELNWTVISFFDAEAVDNIAAAIFFSLLPTLTGIILASALMLIIVSRSLKPLTPLAAAAKQVAGGNLGVSFNIRNNDEIAQVSKSFLEIVKSLNILRDNFSKAESSMMGGDVHYRLEDARLSGVYDEMFKSTNNIAEHIQHSQAEAERANKAKSDFLATMSHEIRTPMNAIIGISDIELDRENHPPETIDSFDRIRNSGKTLLGIINDILDLSKIETGKFELIPILYDTPSLINDTVRLNAMRIGGKPVELIIKIAETLPTMLLGDELRIKQILNNILSNAIKYTDQGSVTFEADSRIDGDSVMLIFTIRDTGQGMTAQQLNELYDEYSMFNQEANRTTEGTGLGMSITKKLIEMMDGKIEVESKPGVGTTFTVHLVQRLEEGSAIGKELAENLQNFRISGEVRRSKLEREYMPYGSVLIVDDVDANLFVAKGLMKPYGLTIETALSGYEALDKIRSGVVYDVLFMDHMMPEMDGMETTKLIRETGYSNPIIALTANAVVGQKEIFLENGFDGFISKPIDTRHLNDILNKQIRDKQPPEVLEEARRTQENRPPVFEDSELSTFNFQLSTLKAIDGLDVDSALAAMSGLQDVYLDTAKLTIRLLPERISKMDRFINEDIKAFTIEVHGLKSVLKNIGAATLGNDAAVLERAALEDNRSYCSEFYPSFRAALSELADHLNAVFSKKNDELKKSADKSSFLQAISDAKTAAGSFDRDNALELLMPHMSFTYGQQADEVLNAAVSALETFDCEAALESLIRLETEL